MSLSVKTSRRSCGRNASERHCSLRACDAAHPRNGTRWNSGLSTRTRDRLRDRRFLLEERTLIAIQSANADRPSALGLRLAQMKGGTGNDCDAGKYAMHIRIYKDRRKAGTRT